MPTSLDSRKEGKKKKDKHQDAGLVEKWNMKMKLLSPLNDLISLMNRILFQNQCFIFVQSNNA